MTKKSAKIYYYVLLSKELNKKWLKSKENILISELHTKSDQKVCKNLLLSELPLKSNQKVYKNLLLLLSKVVNKKLPKSLQKSTICWVTYKKWWKSMWKSTTTTNKSADINYLPSCLKKW